MVDARVLERLDGQVALVTGANRGLGAQTAAELAALDATVFAGARDPATMEGIAAATDGQIRPVALDVQDEASIQAAVAHAAREGGRLDILVNNAGIGDWHGTALHNLDAERLDAVLATNLRGPMLATKHALPHLLERPGSRVVNVSSGMGALGEGMSGTAPAYRVTKTGLNGLTAYLHGEYGPRGLLAASVCPGWVRTDMGGQGAPRSLDEGAAGIVHACRLASGAPGGRFWRDGRVIDW
ncbi:MAG: SDR family NAD(P)-dependent oxidoreductase [Thermoplasmatota archaeon]